MHQIKLIIEYDGTNYVGWQNQPNGLAIQQVMEGALTRLLGEPARLHSSGRTDAGVHARGMVACFTTEKLLPMTAYTDGMNCLLPYDISVREAEEVSLKFNPRHDAAGKHYRYTILTAFRRSPISRLYAWHLREKPDLELMRQGAELFCGEHDFAAFRTSGCAAKGTIRKIDALTVTSGNEIVQLDVFGTGFMRNMVRIMVGTLVEIGLGKMKPEHVSACLLDPSQKPGPTAPAHGLCLEEVFYTE